jgi:TRAP-type C4-dicarboxylate transport system permease small subunit
MLYLNKFNRFAETFLENFLGILLLGITFILCFNVIGRYVFLFSLIGAEEITNYIIIWITLLGSGICVRRGMHMSVDIIFNYVIGLPRKFLLLLGIAGSLLFALLIAIVGLQQVQHVIQYPQLTPALRLPMYIPYLALPLGGLFMVSEYIEMILRRLQEIKASLGGDEHCSTS